MSDAERNLAEMNIADTIGACVEYIVGTESVDATPLKIYSDEAISFISDLSSRIFKSQASRIYPDLAALAFWARKGNLIKLKENCPEADIRLGRGICFHIAPANIPINFIFTYLFGLLAGCSNIVRIPSRRFPQAEAALMELQAVLKEHPEIEKRTAFIKYPADNAITACFSKKCDARMIWGGDSTIATIRSLPTKPRCIDICFADRYSICIIDGKKILEATDEQIKRISEGFYNDTYLMDQNACSSPQMIYWLNSSLEARDRFWNAVYELAEKKYDLQAAVSVNKYLLSCEDSISHSNNISKITRKWNLLYRVEVDALNEDIVSYRGHGGYFYEHAISSLDEIATFVSEKYQTVTYFGVEPHHVQEMVLKHHLRGIDRIVPVGRAMDVGVIWDGYDLVRMLSRIVNAE